MCVCCTFHSCLRAKECSALSVTCSHFFFFFSSRRRHTRSDRDWSSDVCSSDLSSGISTLDELTRVVDIPEEDEHPTDAAAASRRSAGGGKARSGSPQGAAMAFKIGRASCRERV